MNICDTRTSPFSLSFSDTYIQTQLISTSMQSLHIHRSTTNTPTSSLSCSQALSRLAAASRLLLWSGSSGRLHLSLSLLDLLYIGEGNQQKERVIDQNEIQRNHNNIKAYGRSQWRHRRWQKTRTGLFELSCLLRTLQL